jgi:hypothetical protein
MIQEIGFALDSPLEEAGFDLSVLSAYRKTLGIQPLLGKGTKRGFVPGFVPEGWHKKPRLVRSFAG